MELHTKIITQEANHSKSNCFVHWFVLYNIDIAQNVFIGQNIKYFTAAIMKMFTKSGWVDADVVETSLMFICNNHPTCVTMRSFNIVT